MGAQVHHEKVGIPCALSVSRPVLSHFDVVTCVAFHPTEAILISGSQDCTLKMSNLQKSAQNRRCGGVACCGSSLLVSERPLSMWSQCTPFGGTLEPYSVLPCQLTGTCCTVVPPMPPLDSGRYPVTSLTPMMFTVSIYLRR